MLLPGVGEQMAQRIARYRADKGPFQKIDDLRKVPGIGPATLERVRGSVFISANPVISEAAAPAPVAFHVEPARAPAPSRRKAPISIQLTSTAPVAMNSCKFPGLARKWRSVLSTAAQKPFQTVADLRSVSGIGPKILEKMRPFVVVK